MSEKVYDLTGDAEKADLNGDGDVTDDEINATIQAALGQIGQHVDVEDKAGSSESNASYSDRPRLFRRR